MERWLLPSSFNVDANRLQYAIPFREMQINNNLVQNPGYNWQLGQLNPGSIITARLVSCKFFPPPYIVNQGCVIFSVAGFMPTIGKIEARHLYVVLNILAIIKLILLKIFILRKFQ
jgi:hypothetical protein